MPDKRELVLDLHSGETRAAVPFLPLIHSGKQKWQGFHCESHSTPAFELQDVMFLNHVVGIHLSAAVQVEWSLEGHQRIQTIRQGEVSIIPSQLPFSVRGSAPGSFLMISFESNFLTRAGSEVGVSSPIHLTPCTGAPDPLIHSLSLALKSEIDSADLQSNLYAETLAITLAVHLTQKYSSHKVPLKPTGQSLTKSQLNRALDFINDRLETPISVTQIAAAVELSPFHFSRMFKRSTGESPHQYVIRQRLQRAKELLFDSAASIAEIAHRLKFCNQSHLSSHFKRTFGVTPNEYLRRSVRRTVISPTQK